MIGRPPTAQQLRTAAKIAVEKGVTITIDAGGRVYRIAPGQQDAPLLTSEKDQAACDQAFGLSG